MKVLLTFFLFINLGMASDLHLVGKGLLEYSIFKIDVYEVSYYKGKDGLEELVLDYKIDVEKKHSIEGWKVGLKDFFEKGEPYKSKIEWIYNTSVDLKEGDKLIIRKNKHEVIFIKNKKEIAKKNDEIIAKIIFHPWIGPKPIDEDLKKQILNIKET